MAPWLRVTVRWLVPGAALVLHAIVMVAHAGRWDKAAALTVFPLWFWGLAGLGLAGFSWLWCRGRLALCVAAAWIITVLVCADEVRPLLRFTKSRPLPGAPADEAGRKVLRVVSLNCRHSSDAAAEVIRWQPDIILFQETPPEPGFLPALAQELWPGQGSVLSGVDCAILARGKIARSLPGQTLQFVQGTLDLPDGHQLEVTSLHLHGAQRDTRLWRWQTWRDHAQARHARRLQIADLVNGFLLPIGGHRPCLLGGDFNAPAGDRAFHTLDTWFTDAVAEAGAGWPDTFPNARPLLRLDQVWATGELEPLRATTALTKNSDHRMVIVDFGWKG